MPKITIVLIAFVAAIIWVFIINGHKTATESPHPISEKVTQSFS